MIDYSSHYYAPVLKWKLGEVQALGSVRPELSDHILPMFVVPPSSEFDYDKLQTVTLVEHLKQFGSRLKAYCGDRPALVDASLLDAAELHDRFGCHPLLALLERARQNHAFAYPVVSLSSTPEYVRTARAFLARHDHLGFAIRFRVSEFDRPGWADDLDALIYAIGQRVEKAVLLLDAGVLFQADGEFVNLLTQRINRIPHLKQWGGFFFSSTAFPEHRDTPIGDTGRFARSDKALYDLILDHRRDLDRVPRFSDYALEFPSKFRKGGGTPKAHLRYSSPTHFLVAEGETTKGNGFRAIYPVAANLTAQMEFKGPGFSQGNAFFHELAKNVGPGNPSKWRWGATDHHLTVVVTEQSKLHGFSIAAQPVEESIQQVMLPGIFTQRAG